MSNRIAPIPYGDSHVWTHVSEVGLKHGAQVRGPVSKTDPNPVTQAFGPTPRALDGSGLRHAPHWQIPSEVELVDDEVIGCPRLDIAPRQDRSREVAQAVCDDLRTGPDATPATPTASRAAHAASSANTGRRVA